MSASDDFAAFEASIDNPQTATPAEPEPKPEPTPAPEGQGDQDGEGEPRPEPEAGASEEPPLEPKAKKTAQQRIDELTWKAAEAERREKAAQDRLEAALAGKQPTAAPQAPASGDRPDPNDYEFGEEDAAFIRDDARFEARMEFEADRRREEGERSQAVARQAFDQRKAEAFPEGESDSFKAFCALETVPTALNDIIMISDVGPQLAAHYGDNKTDLERLSAMPLHLQAYEILKVEGRLAAATAAPAQAENPKPQPKIATDAPNPAPQVRGSGGQFKVAADTDDFAAFEKAYP